MKRARRYVTLFALLACAMHCGTGEPSSPDGVSPVVASDADVGTNAPVEQPRWGLDELAPNTTCLAPVRPTAIASGSVVLMPAFPNLDTEREAIGLERRRLAPNEPMRWFAAQRSGKVFTFVDRNASKTGLAVDGTTTVEKAELFFEVDVAIVVAGEGGMLAIAFDPDVGVVPGAADVYVHFVTEQRNELWRYRVVREAGAFVTKSRTRVWQNDGHTSIHYGGAIAFGPDRNLYVAIGDGAFPEVASMPERVRGKILRISPLGESTYSIPADNPYDKNAHCSFGTKAEYLARVDPCPETYALGLRNPWRIAFDRESGMLWSGDVGEVTSEEVNRIERARHYGWNTCEGTSPTNACPPTTGGTTFTPPVAQFRRAGGQSIAGGFVYRGSALGKAMQGAYVFGETFTGDLYAIDGADAIAAGGTVLEHPDETSVAPAAPRFRKLGVSAPLVVAFAEDENAELYALTIDVGVGKGVMQLVPQVSPPADTLPKRLSVTGCVDPADARMPAPGVLPYDVNAGFWSEGALTERFLALPPGAKLTTRPDGHFEAPVGSVLMQTFRTQNGLRIETRLLVRHPDGGYAGYSYRWEDDQRDAVLVGPTGERARAGDRAWTFPSRARCLSCHTDAAGNALGLDAHQLQRDFAYPGGRNGNQLGTLRHLGLVEEPFEPVQWSALAEPAGSGTIDARARAHLHASCSMCHRGVDGRIDLRADAPTTRLCDAPGWIVPGSPAASPLLGLMNAADPRLRMPLSAGQTVDTTGISLVSAWIGSRGSCP